jgi:hypothetical protein
MDHFFLILINGGGPLCTIPRLKPIRDRLISNFAFNCKLRRYSKGLRAGLLRTFMSDPLSDPAFYNTCTKAGAYTRPHLSST